LNSRIYKHILLVLSLLIYSFLFFNPVSAQASGPIYIVQPGDSLSSIAARFNVTVAALMDANHIADPNFLDSGQQLIIPGLEGITGVLDTEIINFGDSYRSLERRTQVPEELFKRLNHLVSPSEFYVGASMIIPVEQSEPEPTSRLTPASGESLFELAVKENSDTWTLASFNHLSGTWDGLPGDVLYVRGGSSGELAGDQAAGGLPSAFISAEIRDLPIKQGRTGVIKVKTEAGATLGGMLVDHELHFFPIDDGTQVALQGVHALLDPGVYPLRLDATLPDGTKQSFEQMVLVVSGNYPKEALTVSTELIDPAVTGPEDLRVESITSPVTPGKSWQGKFSLPVYVPAGEQPCIYDWFGTRRAYNGGDYDQLHAGIDYGVCFAEHPFDIYAAAAGTVVFTGPLTVRGNATIIDHGWGIYSGYWHQEESYVSVGQVVQQGELIGKIGGTGRVTGPHLHWEMWVNGIQVDPLDWLAQVYP
jgi:murein DD-endopeptidase MepM/ murein hydrolase activator NlpD